MACVLRCGPGVLCLLLATAPLSAQDLDPRAYARVAVGATFFVAGFSVSHGGVVSDPTLPIADIDATYYVGVGPAPQTGQVATGAARYFIPY